MHFQNRTGQVSRGIIILYLHATLVPLLSPFDPNTPYSILITNVTTIFIDTCSKLSASRCAACGCDSKGSVTTTCNTLGKCTCKTSYYGPKCTNRDCVMAPWSHWTNCRCGYSDKKSRSRTVQTAPAGEGLQCLHMKEDGVCTMTPCDCATMKPGFHGNRCENRDCVMNQWSYWKDCGGCPGRTQRCQAGYCGARWPDIWPTGYRTRSVKITKVGGGKECGAARETASCGYKCYQYCRSSWTGGYTAYNCYYRKA